MSIFWVISLLFHTSKLTHILAGGEYGTALHAAEVEGHIKIAQLLMKHQADDNLQGNKPMIQASYT
jgi:hypothetical protein